MNAAAPETHPLRPRRLVYFGTPALATAPLAALHEAGFEIELVVSATDKRRGRGGALSPSPVKQQALDLGLAVTDDPDDIMATGAEAGVVVAYGRIIRPHLLERMPMLNLHVSLLPRWRGAAPIERAILAGDETTGVCVMDVANELDTGGVHASATTPIDHKDVDDLRSELIAVGTALLIDVLHEGIGAAVPQDGEMTYAVKIDPAERRLVWDRPAVELDRVVRIGGAWTTFRGRRLKVLAARDVAGSGDPGSVVGEAVATSEGLLRLVTVQPEGKTPMSATDWLRGAAPTPNERLGE